ncbi:amino acid ABC transporter ATP-binding protein [Enterococcus sp. 669A]|uniref:Amino acid ABC transporter ATP-binding protein n=1 Tax=Candidatus Enterococcus moelleringii TaxID=2815325 RepID=A0ABS3LG91_9ENTE|nr:amino acid ABC transporter ATP-binding protein [Enterococcus sp. 669A]MBO1307384.1 amino acid ABC transporter ATP-binding protein [Enterococcus sp. 669A]
MLTIENLTKAFDDQTVLKNITVSFREGETTAILGPSGSGKSTFLRAIDLLEIPESGRIAINDLEVTFPSNPTFKEKKNYRQYFSIVFQAYNLFPHFTVLQNIMEGPVQVKGVSKDQARQKAIQLLTRVGLADKQNAYPAQLSGGQQQRVAIARALAMEPLFMLYDEPTSALDPELSNEVLLTIQQLAEAGNSQIVVTHNLEFARKVADRILFMDQGQLLFDGSTELFFRNKKDRIQQFIQQIA